MSTLKVRLLGPPEVEVDGAVVEFDTRKGIALLSYLLVTGQRHSRDALAALLWPDYGETRARASLRRTLSTLHRVLDDRWLDIERESVGLSGGTGHPVDVDLGRFRDLLAACTKHGHAGDRVCDACLPLLAQAAETYRDDFLAGFTLRDSPPFDEWQFFQAEGLRRELAGVLERLVRGHAGRGEYDLAIPHARRRLALDPLHEPAHRDLMELYARSGERSAALRQYGECVRILQQELGVEPLEETTQLYLAIKENRLQLPPSPAPEVGLPAPAVVATGNQVQGPEAPESTVVTLPMVGRAEHVSLLQRIYDAIGERGHVMIVEGEGGIGKTRLAEEFLAGVRRQGAMTIMARCYEGETNLTYGPFVEGLRGALASPAGKGVLQGLPDHTLSELTRLLPELARDRANVPTPTALDGPGAQNRFFEGIREVLLALGSGTHPGVFFVDDLQWADPAAVELLAYILRRLPSTPICVLATWRSEHVPDSHRLRQVLADAQRAAAATVVPLRRLSHDEVAEFVRAVLDRTARSPQPVPAPQPDVEALSTRLYAESEGLPLFVHEYLAAFLEHGSAADPGALPGGVRDLLLSRLRPVSETGWQLLHTAAAIGRSFDFDTLRDASGRSEEETIEAIEALLAHGIIDELDSGESGPRYDFSHAKLRSLVYEETSQARRRLLHRRIAESLATRERSRREAGALSGRIGHHYRLAGQRLEAAEHFKQAGDHARALYANADALEFYRSALELGHAEKDLLHENIGDLLTLMGDYGEAVASYQAAAREDPPALASLSRKIGAVYLRRGEWERAEMYFQAALARLDPSAKAEQARIYADWSLAAHRRGYQTHDDPSALAHQALRLAEAAGDRPALAQAHNIVGILAKDQGRLEEAEGQLLKSLTLAEELGDHGALVAALNNLALVYRDRGMVEAAIARTERALAICATLGDRHREAALHNNLADLQHSLGAVLPAMQHLKQAVTIFAEIGMEAGTIQPEIWKLTEW